jgi:hypothetical protein
MFFMTGIPDLTEWKNTENQGERTGVPWFKEHAQHKMPRGETGSGGTDIYYISGLHVPGSNPP